LKKSATSSDKKVLLVDEDAGSRLLLTAILQSINLDIHVSWSISFSDAKKALAAEDFHMVIVGLSSAGSRARLGFLSFLRKHYPQAQPLLVRSTKSGRSNKRGRAGKRGPEILRSRFLSLHLSFEQSRKLIERLLNSP
jgi:DNA-binding NtrC family response regulator